MASSTSQDRPYPFQRNHKASMRLNFNHFWMKSIAGYLIHPKIPIDRENLRIADIGAGTGIWASEVATTLPSSTVDAIDISAEQYPPEDWRLPNVRYAAHDCFEPFSEEYVGKFDIVHVQFLLRVVDDDRAEALIQNLSSLLRPGGYLQWFEPLPYTAYVLSSDTAGPTPACDKFVQMWKKPAPHTSSDWVHNLASLFRANNLQAVVDEQYENPAYYRPIAAQSALIGLEEFMHVRPDLQDLQEKIGEEFQKGAIVNVRYSCVVGKKP
ncbi:S-adenosyl-L-methionine-dependent methyltransferase [Lophiostoma macrostomum CBS 122681]|uniref:S-adenosyl-L-methionine-dependent methyltransferase n=1 Tax=Lophiostoma macrostomum CBS 122681 TaxID=1314788 RepID=A0A6A6SR19_9PLEO|nr:S-adenosyl-L-methionine-dependent methyltransferase [Lophiostoma macrostomum CBS 122681]